MKFSLLPHLLLIGVPLLSMLAREAAEPSPMTSAAQVSPADGHHREKTAPKKNDSSHADPAAPSPPPATPKHLFM